MKVERDSDLVIKNIDEIASTCQRLVKLGGGYLLPQRVVECVLEAEESADKAEVDRGVLRMMCEDPGC